MSRFFSKMNILITSVLASLIFLLSLNSGVINGDGHEKANFFSRLALNFEDISNLLRGVSVPIDNKCLSYYKSLADISSKFIECVANNSRPFHVCQNCLMPFLKFNQLHKLIQNVIFHYYTELKSIIINFKNGNI